jgi:hypothetical protein
VSPRWHVLLRPHEPLTCPRGHKLKHNAALLQHDVFICQHRAERGQGECGSRSYVLAMPGGYRYVAEVTPAEMLAMRDAQMDVDQVLAFLRLAKAA